MNSGKGAFWVRFASHFELGHVTLRFNSDEVALGVRVGANLWFGCIIGKGAFFSQFQIDRERNAGSDREK